MLFSELYKVMVNKVTFVGFRWGNRPSPLDPTLSEACKYSITSAVVMAAAMNSCSSSILGIERFASAYARQVFEQMFLSKGICPK